MGFDELWLFWAVFQVYLIEKCHLDPALSGLLNGVNPTAPIFFISVLKSILHQRAGCELVGRLCLHQIKLLSMTYTHLPQKKQ